MAVAAARANAELINTITDGGAVTLADFGFTDDQLKLADYVHITAIDGDLYYTYSGLNDPTTSAGHIIVNGGKEVLQGRANASQLKLIAKTGSVNVIITISSL